jgi:hypothetical protein
VPRRAAVTESAAEQPEGVDPLVLQAWAAEERRRADEFAAFLEDVAASGLPASTGGTWEELRERRLAELDEESGRAHVA